MSEAVKKITTDKYGNTVITVEWNGRTFIVGVGDTGVSVDPADKKGRIRKGAYPNVWIDPYEITDRDRDPKEGEAPLLVHSYFNNQQEAPVTVELTKDKATVRGDGLPFAEIKRNPRTSLNIVEGI